MFSHQFDFKQKYSANHSLINLTKNIRHALVNDFYGCGKLVDLLKTFNTSNYKTVIGKRSYYGVIEISTKWLRSYFKVKKVCLN